MKKLLYLGLLLHTLPAVAGPNWEVIRQERRDETMASMQACKCVAKAAHARSYASSTAKDALLKKHKG